MYKSIGDKYCYGTVTPPYDLNSSRRREGTNVFIFALKQKYLAKTPTTSLYTFLVGAVWNAITTVFKCPQSKHVRKGNPVSHLSTSQSGFPLTQN